MKAIVLKDVRRIEVEEVLDPVIPKNYVLIKVKAVGICGTDIAMYRGTLKPRKLPIIPGHEVSGIIEDVGVEVDKNLIGKKVTFEINIVDYTCEFCRKGLYTHCINRKVIGIDVDGGMAEYVIVPVSNIHIIDDLDFEEGVFIEPLAACLRAITYLPTGIEYNAIVLGQGPIAYLITQVFKIHGFNVIVVGTRWERLKYFKEIADYVINLNEVDPIQEVKKYFRYGVDIVVEVTGNPNALDLAIELVKPRGYILAKSTHGLPTTFNYTKLVVNEITIIPSRCGTFIEYRKAIELLKKKLVKVRDIITHRFTLNEGKKAFEIADKKEGMKVIITP